MDISKRKVFVCKEMYKVYRTFRGADVFSLLRLGVAGWIKVHSRMCDDCYELLGAISMDEDVKLVLRKSKRIK